MYLLLYFCYEIEDAKINYDTEFVLNSILNEQCESSTILCKIRDMYLGQWLLKN